MLVKSKYFLEIPRKDGLTALGIACLRKESYPIVRILSKAGANVNQLTQNGIGPLNLALAADNQ